MQLYKSKFTKLHVFVDCLNKQILKAILNLSLAKDMPVSFHFSKQFILSNLEASKDIKNFLETIIDHQKIEVFNKLPKGAENIGQARPDTMMVFEDAEMCKKLFEAQKLDEQPANFLQFFDKQVNLYGKENQNVFT